MPVSPSWQQGIGGATKLGTIAAAVDYLLSLTVVFAGRADLQP